MPVRLFIWMLLITAAALGVAAWMGKLPAWRTLLPAGVGAALQAPATTGAGVGANIGAGTGNGAGASQARKCRRGEQILYTDGPCPAGTQAMALDGGSLSVLPAAPRVAPADTASAASSGSRPGAGGAAAQADRLVDQALQR